MILKVPMTRKFLLHNVKELSVISHAANSVNTFVGFSLEIIRPLLCFLVPILAFIVSCSIDHFHDRNWPKAKHSLWAS